MKKLLVSIIAVLYLVSASGVIVDIHYCLGDLSAVTGGKSIEDDCGKCGKEKSTSKWIKIQDAHQHVKLPKQIKHFVAESPLPKIIISDKWIAAGQLYSLQYFATPEPTEKDIYLQNRVLRI